MYLLEEAIKSDTALAVAAKYLMEVVRPYAHMPLTGDTDDVEDYQLPNRIKELETLIFRLPPTPSGNVRIRYVAEQLFGYALDSGTPLGDEKDFSRWVDEHGTLEDRVMETVFEIDLALSGSFSMIGPEIQSLGTIRRNLLLNHTIYAERLSEMISGGPGSQEELNAFLEAINNNLTKARTILLNFDLS